MFSGSHEDTHHLLKAGGDLVTTEKIVLPVAKIDKKLHHVLVAYTSITNPMIALPPSGGR